jgi:hypothetical protein
MCPLYSRHVSARLYRQISAIQKESIYKKTTDMRPSNEKTLHLLYTLLLVLIHNSFYSTILILLLIDLI